MTKRMILMLTVVAVVLAAIGGVKYLQVSTAMAQQGSFQPPPEAVTTVVAEEEEWDSALAAIGTVVAVNGVMVSADLPGVVEQIGFESGRPVSRGTVLVRLDASQERAQLAAAAAARELARLDLERKKALLTKDAIPQSLYDQVSAELAQADARVGEIRAAIDRKTIRAPFSGLLGIRRVNLGQYLAPGTPIVSLQALEPAYVEFTLPQQEAGGLTRGARVAVTSDAIGGVERGTIEAFDPLIEEATRSVRVQAIFDNRSRKMRPGMFVEVRLDQGKTTRVIPLPASSISYAPFGDSVFIVEPVKGPDGTSYTGVRQQFVKLGGSRGDQVAVVSGIEPGEEIVTSGAFKLRPGAAVQVNNELQPSNSPAPSPEDS
ncbi:MAG TPA: efflux RND transporter periplasmic adaptor subunit [Thermoanaerobaculia bacterium]|nr:efflux RND transporter periplasmic adaptor subunit [Thermoanaerobaculia bacterium]